MNSRGSVGSEGFRFVRSLKGSKQNDFSHGCKRDCRQGGAGGSGAEWGETPSDVPIQGGGGQGPGRYGNGVRGFFGQGKPGIRFTRSDERLPGVLARP